LAALLPSAPALAQDTTAPQDTAQLPPDMAEVLTAVQAAHDPRALDALVQYLLHTHPESQSAISAWVARSALVASLAGPVVAPSAEIPADALSPADLPVAGKPDPVLLTGPLKLSGEGELGAFLSTGTAPGSGFVGRLTVVAEGGRWRIATSGRLDYQKTSNVVTRNQLRLTLEPNYKFDDHGYIFGLGQYEKDRFQGFTDRYSLSVGLGYNLLDQDGRKLSVKAGPAMRLTQPVTGPVEKTLSAVALADLKLRLTPSLSYSQEVSTYFDAVRRTYYTLAALDSQLSGKLKARISYTLQHEDGSGDVRKVTDTTSRLTLLYGF
jgi:putative salt-induced outer membrane protein